MPRDPEKRREQLRRAQQKFRDKKRNPGPGRPRKDGKPKQAAPAPAPPPVPEAPLLNPDEAEVMDPETAERHLSFHARHAEKTSDRIAANRILSDRRIKQPAAAADGPPPDLIEAWNDPDTRAMLEKLIS